MLIQLASVRWVDHQRVSAFGFRFGANVAVRLAYLEPQRLRGVTCLGPVVHRSAVRQQHPVERAGHVYGRAGQPHGHG